MKVRYLGPSPAVDIPLPDGGYVTVERGHQVEVPYDLGRSLARQDAFERVEDKDKADKADEKKSDKAAEPKKGGE